MGTVLAEMSMSLDGEVKTPSAVKGLTHSTPNGWPCDHVPFTFLPGVEQAVPAAQATAGGKSAVSREHS